MDNEYITLKSYDNKLVRVPIDKKEEYVLNQRRIQKLMDDGKSIHEILELLRKENDK